jgi:hypothetical protein
VRFPVGADVTEFFDIAVADKSVVSCFFFILDPRSLSAPYVSKFLWIFGS